MNAAARIGGFGAVLLAIFAVATAVGAAVDPDIGEPRHEENMKTMEGHSAPSQASAGPTAVPGLAVSEGGYTLIPETTSIEGGDRRPFRFRIVAPDGETVREFDVEHERRMHLIVIRRDFDGFQHLHPRQLENGGWEVDLKLTEGGVYRAFADFATDGESLTLATDLFVAGTFEPSRIPAPAPTANAGDGYEVSIESAEAEVGQATAVRFVVSKDGRELESVEPYLGADGHLVALREHDQAFLHTHPEGEAGGPGPISFMIEYPSAGRYRLFLQFKHRGDVRTAAFTQVVRAGPVSADAGGEANGGH